MTEKFPTVTALCIGCVILLNACATYVSQKPSTSPLAKTESSLNSLLERAAAQRSAPFEGQGWKLLFNGRSLEGWKVTDFSGHGAAECQSGLLVIDAGDELSGITWTNDLPKMNYEVALDAMRVKGSDFFCGLTFPVGGTNCSLILGGWGGAVTGLSSIDSEDASENETSLNLKYETGKWYRVRVRVTEGKIEAWLDTDKIVDLKTQGRKIALRFGEIELSRPLGLATYQTTAALKEIRIRPIDSGAADSNQFRAN